MKIFKTTAAGNQIASDISSGASEERQVLGELSRAPAEVDELSLLTGLPKARVSRIMVGLQRRGYVTELGGVLS